MKAMMVLEPASHFKNLGPCWSKSSGAFSHLRYVGMEAGSSGSPKSNSFARANMPGKCRSNNSRQQSAQLIRRMLPSMGRRWPNKMHKFSSRSTNPRMITLLRSGLIFFKKSKTWSSRYLKRNVFIKLNTNLIVSFLNPLMFSGISHSGNSHSSLPQV